MDDLDTKLAELLVATSDYSDDGLPASLHQALRALREHLHMDVVFVSQFAGGQRKFVAVDAAPGHDVVRPGMADPLEVSWCHNIVQGRLPELIRDGVPLIKSGQAPFTPLQIGTHLSVPVVMPDGKVFGTLCTFSFHVEDRVSEADVARLRNVAKMLATRLAQRP